MSILNETKTVVHDKKFSPPEELSDYEIQMIHAGLLIPNGKSNSQYVPRDTKISRSKESGFNIMNTQDTYLWSLCTWREARSSQTGMLAVAWVMWNRLQTGKWGKTMTDVVTARLQFSSMTALGDPETILWPNSHCTPGDLAAWQYALFCPELVQNAGQSQDPTNGSTFYFANTIAKPSWADNMTLIATIGNQQFYREVA